MEILEVLQVDLQSKIFFQVQLDVIPGDGRGAAHGIGVLIGSEDLIVSQPLIQQRVPMGDEILSSLSCLQLTTIFSKASKLMYPCPLGSASQIISSSSSSLAYFPNSRQANILPKRTFLSQFLESITLPSALYDSNFSKHLFFSFSLRQSSLQAPIKFLFFFLSLLIQLFYCDGNTIT